MGKTRLMRKALAWVVCVLLACSMLPAVAFAGGDGLTTGSPADGTIVGQGSSVLTTQSELGTQASGSPTITLTNALLIPITLKQGSTYSLGAKASSGATVTYRSVTPSRVSVTKDGTLKARATGTTAIAVTAKNSSGTTTKRIRVRVLDAGSYKAVKSISAKMGVKSLPVGQTANITTAFTPSNASYKNLLYKSLTPSVATVDTQGKVTAKAAGTAKVRVSSTANTKATCTITFKVTPKVVPKLNSYSWAQLKTISKKIAAAKTDAAGLNIAKKYGLVNANGKLTGAKKSLKLTDGTKAYVRILGFRQDKLSSGGVSGISFEFANVPTTYCMNEDATNEGGWALSDMRSWLNSDFYKKLPADLRTNIAPAKKRTNNLGYVDDMNDKSVVSTTKDKLWLLSSVEVYGSSVGYATYNAEGSQYKLFTDKKVTTSNYSFCKKSGADSWWWFRSPSARTSNYFHRVYNDGSWGDNYAGRWGGVSPGFCF